MLLPSLLPELVVRYFCLGWKQGRPGPLQVLLNPETEVGQGVFLGSSRVAALPALGQGADLELERARSLPRAGENDRRLMHPKNEV